MTGLQINLLVVGICLVLLILGWYFGRNKDHRELHSYDLACFVGIVGGVIAILILMINPWMRSLDRNDCEQYALHTEREVKFVRYTYFSWDCLVQTSEGWISKEDIRKIED